MKDIKLRIRSVESTMQITKAMQLVASSKLRGARARMEASRPYMKVSRRAIWDIAAHNTGAQSHYVVPREIRHRCYIVLAVSLPINIILTLFAGYFMASKGVFFKPLIQFIIIQDHARLFDGLFYFFFALGLLDLFFQFSCKLHNVLLSSLT